MGKKIEEEIQSDLESEKIKCEKLLKKIKYYWDMNKTNNLVKDDFIKSLQREYLQFVDEIGWVEFQSIDELLKNAFETVSRRIRVINNRIVILQQNVEKNKNDDIKVSEETQIDFFTKFKNDGFKLTSQRGAKTYIAKYLVKVYKVSNYSKYDLSVKEFVQIFYKSLNSDSSINKNRWSFKNLYELVRKYYNKELKVK